MDSKSLRIGKNSTLTDSSSDSEDYNSTGTSLSSKSGFGWHRKTHGDGRSINENFARSKAEGIAGSLPSDSPIKKMRQADSWSGSLKRRKTSSSASEDDENDHSQTDSDFTSNLRVSAPKRKTTYDSEEESEKTSEHDPSSSPNTPASYSEKNFSDSDIDNKKIKPSFYHATAGNYSFEDDVRQKDLGHYNDYSQRLMRKMGYEAGKGLGKYGQGRTEIVEVSKQRGRRGFGLHLEGLEPSDVQWDSKKEEEVSVKEDIFWMPECSDDPPHMTQLRQWRREGNKKLTIDNETNFCAPKVLKDILACKCVFDKLEPEEMRRARTRSNPFETIRGVIFQNRAAMKMANMDAVFDFMFTDPKDENGESIIGPNELLYFADICAGPGGFSEYVLWRKKWEAKGFGFTLKGPNDFKLDEFFAGSPETFEPHYGLHGYDGDGDVYTPENQREFRRFVLDSTEEKGVHFVMADGGFSVEGEENIQEILSKRLYLCQFLTALSILRVGGHFVCKLFDLFTPFSVGLVYLMYRAFKKVCIHKPNTSRPANSERYIICKWRREDTKDIHDNMFEVNARLGELSSSTCNEDVTEVVPLDVLINDTPFYEYMIESNNVLGERQIIHLAKIKAFAQNVDLYEDQQSKLRDECLQLWKIPNKVRSAPTKPDPSSKCRELLQGEDLSYLRSVAEELKPKQLSNIKSIYNYRCMVSGTKSDKSDRGFFLGLGRSHIFHSTAPLNNKWIKLEINLELPADTLIYAEQVYELKGEGKGQRKNLSLHVIDALYLGGKDVRNLHFIERTRLVQKLVKAVSKPSRPNYVPVRMKHVFRLEDIENIFQRLEKKTVKGSGKIPLLCYKMEEELNLTLEEKRHFTSTGLFLIKTVQDPWSMELSKSTGHKYYFNHKTGESKFEIPRASIAPFKSCFTKRIFWDWEDGQKLLGDNSDAHEDKVYRSTILKYVSQMR